MLADDSPALGPTCCCTTDLLDDGRYDMGCVYHEPWRCAFCEYVAVQGGLCVLHERRWVA